MFSLKCVNFFFVFLFGLLPEIIQKPSFFQCKTALGAPAETSPGGSLDHSQERLFSPGWPLGRLWGSRAPFGDHLWISLVAPLVLEALCCPFWMHLGLLWSSFRTCWHPWDHIFLNFGLNFCFTNGCIVKNIFSILVSQKLW